MEKTCVKSIWGFYFIFLAHHKIIPGSDKIINNLIESHLLLGESKIPVNIREE